MSNPEAPVACPYCHERLQITFGNCPRCGQLIRPQPPKDYFIESILAMGLCCVPIGIAALFQAIKVDQHYQRGDLVAAKAASDQARTYVIWTVAAGVVSAVIVAIWFFMMILNEQEPEPDPEFTTTQRLLTKREISL